MLVEAKPKESLHCQSAIFRSEQGERWSFRFRLQKGNVVEICDRITPILLSVYFLKCLSAYYVPDTELDAEDTQTEMSPFRKT